MKLTNVAIVCVTVLVSVALLAVVGLTFAAPADADLGLLLGLVLTNVGSIVATILTASRVEQTRGVVDDLANGKMDAKIRAGVADVLASHLIDPSAGAQLDQDRRVRDAPYSMGRD